MNDFIFDYLIFINITLLDYNKNVTFEILKNGKLHRTFNL